MEEGKNVRLKRFFIWFGIILCATLICCWLATNNGIKTTLKATTNDIICCNFSNNLTNISFCIVPQKNIDSLVVGIYLYNNNHKLLTQKEYFVGTVKKNDMKNVSLSVFDFSLSSLWNLDYFNIKVIGGTITI